MDDVISFCNGVALPRKAFAITFDDGFKNNLTMAAPVLNDFKVPSTFYVTTDFIDRNQMSWIDRIEWAFEEVDRFDIKLPWVDESIRIESVEEKIAMLETIRRYVKSNPRVDVSQLASEIQAQTGCFDISSSLDILDMKLNWSELVALNANTLFTIGGHTHTHLIMSFLDRKSLEFEIDTCLSLLKDKSSIKTVHYSYPEGLSHCYNDEVISELKKRNIKCCPTAEHGINRRCCDPFTLKRVFVN